MSLSVSAIVDFLRQSAFLEPAQLASLRADGAANAEPFVKDLVQRKWLTVYQGKQILQGHGPELLVGPCVVLEPLGEGGVGQVFKARHQRLQQIVALKVVRKQLLAEPEVVKRFQREIDLVSQMSNPHVVNSVDAGPTGSTYFLAMEFIEGTDLARLVQKRGPLAVPQACEYLRQAALGLQHIHERGLIHRDIKPPNLFLTRDPKGGELVKIVDLGLARLRYKTNRSGKTSLVTVLGDSLLVGTPDYLSPEQAIDFHAADIRSDVYSLGCTLYYLLTGQPPFPGGTLPSKLVRHQQAETPDLTQQRPDVSAQLMTVARRLLAKRADERYQTPAEAADALAPLAAQARTTAIKAARDPASIRLSSRKDRSVRRTAVVTNDNEDVEPLPLYPRSFRRRALVIGGATAVVLLLAAAAMFSGIFTSADRPAAKTVAASNPPAKGKTLPGVTPPAPGGGFLVEASAPGWRYTFASNVDLTDERWVQANFDDSTWKTGKAPLGHGGGGEMKAITDRQGTVIPERGVPIVFRNSFNLPGELLQQAGVTYRMNIASDNCATVWLNGERADRETKVSHEFKYWNRQVEVPVKMLRAGRNQIAALAENNKGSSDIYFDMELLAVQPKAEAEKADPTETIVDASRSPFVGHGWAISRLLPPGIASPARTPSGRRRRGHRRRDRARW